MGLIEKLFGLIFGSGRNVIVETAGIFAENAEAGAQRHADQRAQALEQFSGEFAAPGAGRFDRLMDGANRLPRPALALGTLGLFVAAMVDPVWFAARMQGIALVPEPLWWLLGVVVSFYFGARYQFKGQQFQRSITQTLANAPTVAAQIQQLEQLRPETPRSADTGGDADLSLSAARPEANPALEVWRRTGR
ncbi:holin family protein [Rhodobacteraceae bacterium KMM 6894]|nr:holin family protein [Rhodobacteraceae bacterium KMM 6894]